MIETTPLTAPPLDLATFVPMDRRLALAAGHTLPERTSGAVLFADVSGFTPLMETLVKEMGRRRGAEEVLRRINNIYDALITQLHAYAGSVIGFSGDAITCWLDEAQGPAPARAVACALAMQTALAPFSQLRSPAGTPIPTGVKIAIAAGSVRRYLVGDPRIQIHETLVGRPLAEMAAAERCAHKGEILLNEAGVQALARQVQLAGWRADPAGKRRFGVVAGLTTPIATPSWPAPQPDLLAPQQVQPWLTDGIFQRLRERGGWLGGFRTVTALFLRFQGLDFDQDPDAGAQLDAYLRWVQGIVHQHEATLELTIGDKGAYLYAAFGTPIAYADDSARAVDVALQLQKPPAALAGVGPVQIGITRGEVWTGACGAYQRQTYGVMGNEVNLSARLMAHAQPGQILISERVAEELTSQFICQHLGKIQVKGRAAPLPIAAVTGRAPDTIPHLSEQYGGALLGRSAELAQLLGWVDDMVAGAARIVFLEGEAGIGKSRLIAALAGHTRARGLLGFLGAGQAIEQQVPYRAWRDILSSFLGLDKLAESTRARHMLNLGQSLAAPWQERLPLLNDLLTLGLPENEFTRSLSPELRQLNLFRLIAALLQDWSQRRPLLLVIEDAQWLDPLSWELTVYLGQRLPQLPGGALLLLALRPPAAGSDWQPRAAALLDAAQTQQLPLPALTQSAIEAIIAARLDVPIAALPPQLVTFICDKAEGNPFYAEELALYLEEQSPLPLRAAGRHIFSRGLPATLQGLVQARLDRLPPTQQLILKIAAVIGRRFDIAPLQAALDQFNPLEPAALQAELAAIANLGLLQIGQPNPEPVYAFKQVVTQEAAYQSLLFAQRRQLHRTLARWYERTYGGGAAPKGSAIAPELAPHLPRLVYHYRHAEISEREQFYARAAGDQAAAQYANEDAIAYFTRALALTLEGDKVSQYEILLARERIYHLLGARETQADDLARLNALALALGDPARQAQIALRRAYYAAALSDFPAARDAAERALTLAQSAQLAQLEAQAYVAWASARWRQGGYAEAQAYYERGLALLKAVGTTTNTLARVHKGLGIVNDLQGDYKAAHDHYQQALTYSQAAGDRVEMAASYLNLGNLAYSHNNFTEARKQYQQARQLSQDVGDREGAGKVLNNLGALLTGVGAFAQARQYYEESLHIRREIGNRRGVAMSLSNLANVQLLTNETESARANYEASLALYRAVGDQRGEAYSLHNLGLLQVEAGELEAAATSFKQARSLRQALNQGHLASEDSAELAHLAWRQGDDGGCRRYLTQVLAHLDDDPTLSGAEHPFRVFLLCHEILKDQDDVRAGDLLETGYQLLQRQAAQIPDDGPRQTFLEAVPAHRALSEAYAAWRQRQTA